MEVNDNQKGDADTISGEKNSCLFCVTIISATCGPCGSDGYDDGKGGGSGRMSKIISWFFQLNLYFFRF